MSRPSFVLRLLLLVPLLLIPISSQAKALQPSGKPAPDPVASYTISVTLDPDAKSLTAHEKITYVNTTRDPIPDLVFHLYLNAFRDLNTDFMQESGAGHRGFEFNTDHPGWIKVANISLGDGTPLTLNEIEDGTLAQALLPTPLAPGQSLELNLDFQAQLPQVFARTGYAGDFFMVGQWFPKLGVWQAAGWNAYPFHANSEFYADFGTYDVAITLPIAYVTGGTGLPVDTADNGNGTQTVRYHAESVIDFAWTASPHFKTATRQVNNVEVLYLYLPEHASTVERMLSAADFAVSHFGEWYGPYPYPRLTLVDVPDDGSGAGGMEYPTLVTVGTLESSAFDNLGLSNHALETVAIHEIGHQWWQSTVAFNEAEEPWLDEGFTDYSALQALDADFGANTSYINSPVLSLGYLAQRRWEYLAEPKVPMYGRAWEFKGGYVVAAYSKPVLALRTLQNVLGADQMRQLLKTFYQRYQFKHPTTEDFRAVAEEVTAQKLDWFFDGLVYGKGVLNYAVQGLGRQTVTVVRQGDLVIPTEVLVTFVDGTTTLEPWSGISETKTFTYSDKPDILSAEVDPEHKLAVDLRWWDNGLSRPKLLIPWAALTSRLFTTLQNLLLLIGGL
jgi:Peptidase family M1 domain